jgi:hypothetical protein
MFVGVVGGGGATTAAAATSPSDIYWESILK